MAEAESPPVKRTRLPDRASFEFRTKYVLFMTLLTGTAVAMFVLAYQFMLLGFFSILVAILFRTVSYPLLRRSPLPEKAAVLISLSLFLLVATGILIFLSNQIVSQLSELAESLPRATASVREWLSGMGWGRALLRQMNHLGELATRPPVLSTAQGVLTSMFGAISAALVVTVMGIFLAVTPDIYRRGLIRLLPPERRERAGEVLDTLGATMRWWLVGRIISMAVIGVLTAGGLFFLGVQPALALAGITALLTFVPYVGPVLSVIPPALLALSQEPALALWVLGLYTAIQFVESNFLAPVVERKTILLPPALTIFCQATFGLFFGFLGILLASPLLATALVLIKMLYVEDVLGEEVETI